jgi:hypothetical protein
MAQLIAIDQDIWSVTHPFKVNGAPVSSRMTVIRLQNNRIILHSPVPMSSALKDQINSLGQVIVIIAPNKMHHLFLASAMRDFPHAMALAAPGLAVKRSEIAGLQTLTADSLNTWAPELEALVFEGMPSVNETIWFHRPSRSLIVTDLLQWFQGDLSWGMRLWVWMMGVRDSMAVPRHVHFLIKDKPAARRSAELLLQWPFERVIVAHNSVIEQDAYAQTKKAFLTI